MPFYRSLRSRLLLYLALILLVFSVISYWSTSWLLTRNQQQHEQELVEANLRRLQAILHSQQQNLLHSVLDYSQRDETLRFFPQQCPPLFEQQLHTQLAEHSPGRCGAVRFQHFPATGKPTFSGRDTSAYRRKRRALAADPALADKTPAPGNRRWSETPAVVAR